MNTMQALVREQGRVGLQRRPIPVPAADQVLVRVRAAGVCRTDLQVARGELASIDPVVLGHELAGEVTRLGASVQGVQIGQAVSAIPWRDSSMLGVQEDGAFASFVLLHSSQIVPLPHSLPWRHGAYVEPVAAALGAVIHPPPQARVLILGEGRIAALTARVLTCCAPRAQVVVATDGEAASWDVVVETQAHPDVLRRALTLVRPRGRIVLKSRAAVELSLPLTLAQARGATIHPVGHGSFQQAVELLSSGRLEVDDLLTDPRPLSDWQSAFSASEAQKVFLEPEH